MARLFYKIQTIIYWRIFYKMQTILYKSKHVSLSTGPNMLSRHRKNEATEINNSRIRSRIKSRLKRVSVQNATILVGKTLKSYIMSTGGKWREIYLHCTKFCKIYCAVCKDLDNISAMHKKFQDSFAMTNIPERLLDDPKLPTIVCKVK